VAHESFPRFGDDATYSGQCVQSLLRRGNAESSLYIKHLKVNLVPAAGEQKAVQTGPKRRISRPNRGDWYRVTPKASGPRSQIARPEASPAGFCGSWRSR
jgi:hypothetical protein